MYSNALAAGGLLWLNTARRESSRIHETAPILAGFANGKNCRLLMNPNPEKVSEHYVE
jgi:hypothetical protein